MSLESTFDFKYSWTIFHIYGISDPTTFLGVFFWAPIPFKRYQNRSGCSTDTNAVGVSVEAGDQQFLPTIETQMT